MVTYVCPGKECKWGRTFLSVGEIFTFRDRREEGMMSNRAEQLSDRAKRGSDSKAKLDSPSERRSRKGKNLPRKGKCPRGQFPSLDTRLSSSGDSFFFLIWRLFNHKSMPLLGRHLWMPPAPAPLLAVNECLVIYKEPLDHYWDLLGEYGRHLWMPLY